MHDEPQNIQQGTPNIEVNDKRKETSSIDAVVVRSISAVPCSIFDIRRYLFGLNWS